MKKIKKFITHLSKTPPQKKNYSIKAVHLAELIQQKLQKSLTKKDKSFFLKQSKLVQEKSVKSLILQFTDIAIRKTNRIQCIKNLQQLIQETSLPSYFSIVEKIKLTLFAHYAHLIPNITHKLVMNQLNKKLKNIILSEKKILQNTPLNKIKKIKLNYNYLGETILSEKDTQVQINKYKELLKNKNIDTI